MQEFDCKEKLQLVYKERVHNYFNNKNADQIQKQKNIVVPGFHSNNQNSNNSNNINFKKELSSQRNSCHINQGQNQNQHQKQRQFSTYVQNSDTKNSQFETQNSHTTNNENYNNQQEQNNRYTQKTPKRKSSNHTQISTQTQYNDSGSKKLPRKTPSRSSEKRYLNNIAISVVKKVRNTFNIQRERKKCYCDINLEPEETCSKVFKWLNCLQYNNQKDLSWMKQKYETLKQEPRERKNIIQIQKDLKRTYPNIQYFQEGQVGYNILENILNVFAIYEPSLGYVQGMNFIGGVFAYHAEEYLAFWLMALFFEKLELRDVYQDNLPGLKKHTKIMNELIKINLPEISQKFQETGIVAEMYFTPWIFSMLGILIPIENFAQFLDNIFIQGWGYFYRIVLCLLEKNQDEILENEFIEILTLLNKKNYEPSKQPKNLDQEIKNWNQILEEAITIDLDDQLINNMIDEFYENYNLKNDINSNSQ